MSRMMPLLFLLDNQGYDKLHKIKPLLELLFPNFERAYNLHKNISIDECMIPWRGRLSFRQFIASKPIRFGIKVCVLADSESKYIYRQQLYIGRNPGERAEVGLATRVVKELCTGLEGFGHHFYTDNFYTSVNIYLKTIFMLVGPSRVQGRIFQRI